MNSPTRGARAAAPPHRRHALALALLGLAGPVLAQGTAPALERVEIIGTTPLRGSGTERDRLPVQAQSIGAARMDEIGAGNVADLARLAVQGANVVETSGNPWQMELNFRGHIASPLLGQPQGLSVYLDGVRINEAFGDVVHWDLLPDNALAELTVLPGANPVFGLNTLGGALIMNTRSGDTHPGTELELGLGSFGQRSFEIAHGRALGADTFLFVAAEHTRQDGWREHSPSDIRRVFAKLNQDLGRADWALSLQGADNRLIGNGLLPLSLLEENRAQVYTRPDESRNKLFALTWRGGLQIDEAQRAEVLAYHRNLRTRSVNGDLNEELATDPAAEPGVENRARARQRASGLGLQWTRKLGGSQLSLGLAHDRSTVDFEQTEAEGELDASRAVTNVGPEQLNAAIRGHTRTSSAYASAQTPLSADLLLSASGRFNRTRVTTTDVGAALGTGTALDSDHRFQAFNPALGLSWVLDPALTLYGQLARGSRAPSPIELGCSDPAQPCVLPNALQADPPLQQVRSRSLEAGVRGRLDNGWRWNAGLFSSTNTDDILFISNGLSAGYFANVGKTRRQGLELGLQGRQGRHDLALGYTRLSATMRSGACLVAEANSSAETSAACPGQGEIEVRPGDRLPGLPEHLFKAELGWRPFNGLRLAAQAQAQSRVNVRGNENGRHQPDGVDFFGPGHVGGYALLNLRASWKIGSGWSLLGKVDNALDRRYASGGQLGENAFGPGGVLRPATDWRDETFVAPGAPRALGLALQWRGE